MTHSEPAPGTVPSPDSSRDWNEVFDNPELTDAEIAELRPDGEGLPVALAVYKADGPGWQTRMNEALAAGVQSRR